MDTLKATENIIKLYKNSDNENSNRFLDRNSKSQEDMGRCSSSFARQLLPTQTIISCKTILQNWWINTKKTLVQQTLKEFTNTRQAIQRTLEESSSVPSTLWGVSQLLGTLALTDLMASSGSQGHLCSCGMNISAYIYTCMHTQNYNNNNNTILSTKESYKLNTQRKYEIKYFLKLLN